MGGDAPTVPKRKKKQKLRFPIENFGNDKKGYNGPPKLLKAKIAREAPKEIRL